jgi:hypothetical protein
LPAAGPPRGLRRPGSRSAAARFTIKGTIKGCSIFTIKDWPFTINVIDQQQFTELFFHDQLTTIS